eukprot:4588886-Prymnesium_polylepis.1
MLLEPAKTFRGRSTTQITGDSDTCLSARTCPDSWASAMKEPRDIDKTSGRQRSEYQRRAPCPLSRPLVMQCVWMDGPISRLDKSYLMSAMSDAAGCYESHFAWNNSLGVRYKRLHGDNAPDLIKGESEQ